MCYNYFGDRMKRLFAVVCFFVLPLCISAKDINGLKIEGNIIDLKESIYEYDVTVDNDIINPYIEVVVDEGTFYEVKGANDLKVGNNKISIVVSNENEINEYTLNITRLAKDVVSLSSNNYLNNLSIRGYSIGFDKDVLEYNLSIKSEEKLVIDYETDGLSDVYIDGNSDLKQGSVIKIKVIAQSGDVREYKINIVSATIREEIITTNQSSIDWTLFTYIGAIVGISLFLFIINRKK